MKKEPYGYVYKITNKVNNKTLIGIQEKHNINRRDLAIKLRENGYTTHR